VIDLMEILGIADELDEGWPIAGVKIRALVGEHRKLEAALRNSTEREVRFFARMTSLETALRRADDIEHSISVEDWYKQRDALLATSETKDDEKI
jgi:hypothetical protein